jgi:hypothetical protein
VKQLDAVNEPDPGIKEFNALAGELQRLMGSVQGGIPSRQQLGDFLTKLGDISVRAGKLRRRAKDPDGREAVDQLCGEGSEDIVGAAEVTTLIETRQTSSLNLPAPREMPLGVHESVVRVDGSVPSMSKGVTRIRPLRSVR